MQVCGLSTGTSGLFSYTNTLTFFPLIFAPLTSIIIQLIRELIDIKPNYGGLIKDILTEVEKIYAQFAQVS